MVKETLNCYLGIQKPTDKDNYIFKRMDISGFLVGTIFRDLYFRFKNHVEQTVNIQYASLSKSYEDYNDIGINNIMIVLKIFRN